MKLTAKIKLLCTEDASDALYRTIATSNACCEWLSEQAWTINKFNKYIIHKNFYHSARETFPTLSAQAIIRCIAKVADAYKTGKRIQRSFRPLAAMGYDSRILSWKPEYVSIWTVDGRKKIRFVCGDRQREQLKSQHGETDLMLQDGKFYLGTCCDAIEPKVNILNYQRPIGVDLGIVNIATDSHGNVYSGSKVNNIRYRYRKLRSALQKAGTKSAKRHFRKLSGKESRFARDVNHVISKQIVAEAKRTVCGIAVEDLLGIRERTRARKKRGSILHNWAFFQLRSFLEYKAALAGVPIVAIDPINTSRECSECGYTNKANRKTQDKFCCLACGHKAPADYNAACVIASRVNVSTPIAADAEAFAASFRPFSVEQVDGNIAA